MKPIPILGLGIQSRNNNVTAQKRVNVYLEKSDDRQQIVAYSTPGTTLFKALTGYKIRGMYALGSYLYVVTNQNFYKLDSTGTIVKSTILTTNGGQVDMSDNGTQIIIIDNIGNGYIYTIATNVLATITDPDFPVAGSVTFNNGYFIVNKLNSGQFYVSDSYDGSSWDAATFATAEYDGDNLVRVYADHGQLILFGESTIEFWGDSGDLDFPYQRINGSTAEWGLSAKWSIAKFDNSLVWLGKNKLGESQVVRLDGYTMTRISTHDLEHIINNYTDPSDAVAFSYMHNGHPFYQINFLTDNASWLYDGIMGIWSEIKTGNNRSLSEYAISFNNHIVSYDKTIGNLYYIDGHTFTDNGLPLISEIITPHSTDRKELSSIAEIQIDMGIGIGLSTGQGSNPQVILQVSKDGGNTWGAEKFASFGKAGEYNTRAIFRRLGQAREWTFRIKISEPVYRAITGAWITA
jgi:hypothetical protein